MTTGVDNEVLIRQPLVLEDGLDLYVRLIHVEGTLDFYGLLSYHCLTLRGACSPDTQIATLEFGLIRPPQSG